MNKNLFFILLICTLVSPMLVLAFGANTSLEYQVDFLILKANEVVENGAYFMKAGMDLIKVEALDIMNIHVVNSIKDLEHPFYSCSVQVQKNYSILRLPELNKLPRKIIYIEEATLTYLYNKAKNGASIMEMVQVLSSNYKVTITFQDPTGVGSNPVIYVGLTIACLLPTVWAELSLRRKKNGTK